MTHESNTTTNKYELRMEVGTIPYSAPYRLNRGLDEEL